MKNLASKLKKKRKKSILFFYFWCLNDNKEISCNRCKNTKILFSLKALICKKAQRHSTFCFFFKSTKIGVTYVCCVMMCGEEAEGTCDVFFSRATRVVTAM